MESSQLQFYRDRPLLTTVAKLVGSYENSVDSIQDVSPSSSNLTAPSYSPLSELAGMSSNENGSSEETPCSKDCTSSSTDNASSNHGDNSIVYYWTFMPKPPSQHL